MQLIQFDKLLTELSDDSFKELKARTSDYLSFYYVDNLDAVDRTLYLEKLGAYFKQFTQGNMLMSDKKFVDTYYDELNSLIRDRVVSAYKADEFYDKAKKLAKSVNSLMDNEFYTNLEDYTKIFLTIYAEFIKKRDQVKEISFFVNDIDYDALSNVYLNDKPETNKEIKRLKDKVEAIAPRVVRDVFNGAKSNIQGLMDIANNKLAAKNKKKQEKDFELFSSTISEEKEGKYFSKRVFSFIIMTIIYLRLKDFELGL